RRFLPDGTTFLRMNHMLEVRVRARLLLGVHEITRFHKQLVILTPFASGSQKIPVRCATCEPKMMFRVDSLKKRRAIRLRAAIICFLTESGFAVLSSDRKLIISSFARWSVR